MASELKWNGKEFEQYLRKATATAAASSVRVPPRIGPAHLPGEPLITERTKVTLAPPPRPTSRSNTYLMAG
jgi:hypothetical protein